MSVVTAIPTRMENAILDAIRQVEAVPSYGCGTLPTTATEAQGRQCAWDTLFHWLQQTGGNLRKSLAIYNAGEQGLAQNPNQTTVQVGGRTQLYGYGYADAVLNAALHGLGLPGAAAAGAASPAMAPAPSSGGTIPGPSAATLRVIVIVAAGVLIMFGIYGLSQRRRLELIK